ncbi:MAG: aldehyde dehydrogenase family protein [Deltaproteobacteria bacterium]|jgi:aldehyde dehydrogenase (NAD+)|nr:aldehyde dehydrogenase family protein [Deltaproteobacteria bacterium]
MDMLATQDIRKAFKALGLKSDNPGASDGRAWFGNGSELEVVSPINGKVLAVVKQTNNDDYEQVITAAREAFMVWREIPAPKRGEIIRQLGQALRENKDELGRLVTMEMGKSIQEGWGEVQEMIDICDYACGLSRQLYGVQTHSERARHRMYEQWHPLGLVGVITAFNFPAAVWAWNLAIALVCGDVVVWKPASNTPLTSIACQKIIENVLRENNMVSGIATLVIGRGAEIGELLNRDPRVDLISYTGSCRMGKHIASVVGARLGKTILELGGNNAVIVTPNADLDLAAENIFFGAVGTAGQRCTTTRRVIIEESVYDAFMKKLLSFYDRLTIGSPLDERIQMGPLVSVSAVSTMFEALETIVRHGGRVVHEGKKLQGENYPGGCYVTPAVVEVPKDMAIVREETFAPILYLIKYSGPVQTAVAIQNDVPQGLSSSIFTDNLVEAESFLSASGSDCGIANVNLGTSGAEIGLAFGGEKETGGGRESGSDAWKGYMRRQTNTINWSKGTTLAQGIQFE